MKKLLLTTAAFTLFAGASAYAEVNIDLNIGTPAPIYVAPAPVMVVGQPPIIMNDAHHRHMDKDWRYWQEKRERERWEHEHPSGRWDHDRWDHDHR